MKEYINAKLTIVKIKNSDILTVSGPGLGTTFDGDNTKLLAPDRFNDYYEGY